MRPPACPPCRNLVARAFALLALLASPASAQVGGSAWTVAGTEGRRYDGVAWDASGGEPSIVASSSRRKVIVRITADGRETVLAGREDSDPEQRLDGPRDLVVDPDGTIDFVDQAPDWVQDGARLRRLTADGRILTLAGGSPEGAILTRQGAALACPMPATSVKLRIENLVLGRRGQRYLTAADEPNQLFRVTPPAIPGAPWTLDCLPLDPGQCVVSPVGTPSGSVEYLDLSTDQIRSVGPGEGFGEGSGEGSGELRAWGQRVLAGGGPGAQAPPSPARQADLAGAAALALTPRGQRYVLAQGGLFDFTPEPGGTWRLERHLTPGDAPRIPAEPDAPMPSPEEPDTPMPSPEEPDASRPSPEEPDTPMPSPEEPDASRPSPEEPDASMPSPESRMSLTALAFPADDELAPWLSPEHGGEATGGRTGGQAMIGTPAGGLLLVGPDLDGIRYLDCGHAFAQDLSAAVRARFQRPAGSGFVTEDRALLRQLESSGVPLPAPAQFLQRVRAARGGRHWGQGRGVVPMSPVERLEVARLLNLAAEHAFLATMAAQAVNRHLQPALAGARPLTLGTSSKVSALI